MKMDLNKSDNNFSGDTLVENGNIPFNISREELDFWISEIETDGNNPEILEKKDLFENNFQDTYISFSGNDEKISENMPAITDVNKTNFSVSIDMFEDSSSENESEEFSESLETFSSSDNINDSESSEESSILPASVEESFPIIQPSFHFTPQIQENPTSFTIDDDDDTSKYINNFHEIDQNDNIQNNGNNLQFIFDSNPAIISTFPENPENVFDFKTTYIPTFSKGEYRESELKRSENLLDLKSFQDTNFYDIVPEPVVSQPIPFNSTSSVVSQPTPFHPTFSYSIPSVDISPDNISILPEINFSSYCINDDSESSENDLSSDYILSEDYELSDIESLDSSEDSIPEIKDDLLILNKVKHNNGIIIPRNNISLDDEYNPIEELKKEKKVIEDNQNEINNLLASKSVTRIKFPLKKSKSKSKFYYKQPLRYEININPDFSKHFHEYPSFLFIRKINKFLNWKIYGICQEHEDGGIMFPSYFLLEDPIANNKSHLYLSILGLHFSLYHLNSWHNKTQQKFRLVEIEDLFNLTNFYSFLQSLENTENEKISKLQLRYHVRHIINYMKTKEIICREQLIQVF